jgi:hypothetical protein
MQGCARRNGGLDVVSKPCSQLRVAGFRHGGRSDDPLPVSGPSLRSDPATRSIFLKPLRGEVLARCYERHARLKAAASGAPARKNGGQSPRRTTGNARASPRRLPSAIVRDAPLGGAARRIRPEPDLTCSSSMGSSGSWPAWWCRACFRCCPDPRIRPRPSLRTPSGIMPSSSSWTCPSKWFDPLLAPLPQGSERILKWTIAPTLTSAGNRLFPRFPKKSDKSAAAPKRVAGPSR